ncbi:ABC transporter permease [Dyella terrae]|uniref:ABC transporter permease n=1 Tax=Dyella terrae TaxID=522259 RepID=UPI001EFE7FE9|nr:FtsX-like permease family protein [Dyella terrae]ULU27298.1 FtsX-like permease family protein [Dyella terrae]
MSLAVMLKILRRHALMPALVLFQVALACAILCNVLFLVWQRVQPMVAPSGLAEDELVLVDQVTSRVRPWTGAEVRAGQLALSHAPGVRSASAALGLPMIGTMMIDYTLQSPRGVKVGVNGYFGEGLVNSLGLQLVAGRDFLPSEYRDFGVNHSSSGIPATSAAEPIIIPQSLATQLFGDQPAVGQILQVPDEPDGHGYQVVGVVRHLMRNQLDMATDGRADNTLLAAKRVGDTAMVGYAVRIDPAMREVALHGIREAIRQAFGPLLSDDIPVKITTYAERRHEALESARAALWLFAGVTLAVLVVTAIGIMGLTGFWVQRRTRQIGIQRALGARRSQVLRYFMVENLLIAGAGVLIGMALAYVANAVLMRHYELPRLPWAYLPIGGAVVLLLGQLAVWSPARRAADAPPVVATRSV